MAATDHAELVSRYVRFRQIAKSINNRLLKTLSKQDMQAGARRLGMLQGDTIVFGSEEEMDVLMDFCLFDVRRDGQTAVARFAASQPFQVGSDEAVVVQAMTRARYTLVQVDEVINGVGVRANDIIYSRDVLMADQGLGQTAVPGLMLATRMIPFNDFEMSAGAALPVSEERTFEKVAIGMARHLEGQQDNLAELAGEKKSAATADAIRACMAADSSASIEYSGHDEPPATEPIVRENRPGRNDPCPCGSGRKFKRCCGQAK